MQVKMCDLTEFEKGQIVGASMAGASVTKMHCWVSRKLPCQRPSRNSRSGEKLPATGVILAGLPNLPTETDVH